MQTGPQNSLLTLNAIVTTPKKLERLNEILNPYDKQNQPLDVLRIDFKSFHQIFEAFKNIFEDNNFKNLNTEQQVDAVWLYLAFSNQVHQFSKNSNMAQTTGKLACVQNLDRLAYPRVKRVIDNTEPNNRYSKHPRRFHQRLLMIEASLHVYFHNLTDNNQSITMDDVLNNYAFKLNEEKREISSQKVRENRKYPIHLMSWRNNFPPTKGYLRATKGNRLPLPIIIKNESTKDEWCYGRDPDTGNVKLTKIEKDYIYPKLPVISQDKQNDLQNGEIVKVTERISESVYSRIRAEKLHTPTSKSELKVNHILLSGAQQNPNIFNDKKHVFHPLKSNPDDNYIDETTSLELDFPYEGGLAVETDGAEFHATQGGENSIEHSFKDKILSSEGWSRVSIPVDENIEKKANAIAQFLNVPHLADYSCQYRELMNISKDIKDELEKALRKYQAKYTSLSSERILNSPEEKAAHKAYIIELLEIYQVIHKIADNNDLENLLEHATDSKNKLMLDLNEHLAQYKKKIKIAEDSMDMDNNMQNIKSEIAVNNKKLEAEIERKNKHKKILDKNEEAMKKYMTLLLQTEISPRQKSDYTNLLNNLQKNNEEAEKFLKILDGTISKLNKQIESLEKQLNTKHMTELHNNKENIEKRLENLFEEKLHIRTLQNTIDSCKTNLQDAKNTYQTSLDSEKEKQTAQLKAENARERERFPHRSSSYYKENRSSSKRNYNKHTETNEAVEPKRPSVSSGSNSKRRKLHP